MMQCKDIQFYPFSQELPSFVAAELNTPDLPIDMKSSTLLNAINTVNDFCSNNTPIAAFGETSKLSKDSQGSFSSSWAEVLVKTIPEPIVKAKDLQAIALGFGGNSSESSKSADPQLSSGKTQPDAVSSKISSLSLPLAWCCGRLKPAGIVVSGNPSVLVMSVRHMSVTGALLLPTPLTCSSDSELYRRPGQDKLERRLKLLPTPVERDGKHEKTGAKSYHHCLDRELTPMIPQGYVSHPHIREWMMGLPLDSTLITAPAGGQKTPLLATLLYPNAVYTTEAIASQPSEIPALPSNPQSAGSTLTTLPDALSLQPTESDKGKQVYVDVVEKRGTFLGGIHDRIIAGTTTTFALVRFPDCRSNSIFPLDEIELIPEEKATAEAIAENTKSQGEYTTMLVSQQINSIESFCQKRVAVPDDQEVIAELAGTSDIDEFERLGAEIDQIEKSRIFEVGRRLLRMEQLFTPSVEFPDFPKYAQSRFGYKQSYCYELKAAAQAQDVVDSGSSGIALTSINQARPIAKMLNAKVEPEKVKELVAEVAATGELSKARIEQAAQEKGLLPKKEKKTIVADGQSLGLSGKETQQLPDVPSMPDVPSTVVVKPLVECFSLQAVQEAIATNPKSALTEFRSLHWQERFRLREICPDIASYFRTLESPDLAVGAVLTALESEDKSKKIEHLETILVGRDRNFEQAMKKLNEACDERDRLALRVAQLEAELSQVRRVA